MGWGLSTFVANGFFFIFLIKRIIYREGGDVRSAPSCFSFSLIVCGNSQVWATHNPSGTFA